MSSFTFRDDVTFSGGHRVIVVGNSVTKDLLGVISWYTEWHKYVFWPYESTLFNSSGLKEIAEFLDSLSKEEAL